MRAAQYVRMSTEHQQYSIESQVAAISEYAVAHDFEIVRTYSDEARSGIDLRHRPGLKQLLDDIIESRADYRAVLVYDISRWGRFQDADESACYEFLCRRAGVNVLYCAEPFENDLSVTASLVKTLKRAMAGEYLRELSTKVFVGQCRIVRKGYKAGGPAGFGLRRLLLSPDGKPKMLLQRGEYKSLATERVKYTPGPTNEVRLVRKIYSLLLDGGLNCHAIARWLNERGVPREAGCKWNGQMIHKILSHAKYTGSIVFNQKSGRLRSTFRPNPRDQWVVQPNSFPAIISRDRFDLAQSRLNDRVIHRTNEQLLQELRTFVQKHGKATQVMIAADPHMAKSGTYASRFGSFRRALFLARAESPEKFSACERRARIEMWLQDAFARKLALAEIPFKRKHNVFSSSGHPPVVVGAANCFALSGGQRRWEVRYPLTGPKGLRCVVVRLDPDNRSPMDYVYLPCLPHTIQRCWFSQARFEQLGFVRTTLDEVLSLLLADERRYDAGAANSGSDSRVVETKTHDVSGYRRKTGTYVTGYSRRPLLSAASDRWPCRTNTRSGGN